MGKYTAAAHSHLDENHTPFHIRDIELCGETVGLYLRCPAISELEDFEGDDTERLLNKLVDLIHFKGAGDADYEPFDPLRDGERVDPLKVLGGFGIKAGEVVRDAMDHWNLRSAGKGESFPD